MGRSLVKNPREVNPVGQTFTKGKECLLTLMKSDLIHSQERN